MNTSTCPDATPARQSDPPPTSTLIEFPGTSRNRPQWRKELSERVREIQQRRALEAARETEENAQATPPHQSQQTEAHTHDRAPSEAREPAAPQLGLVPTPEPQEINPIVAKALERIERARQQQQHATRQHGRGGAATAAAVSTRTHEEAYRAPAETPAHTPADEAHDATESSLAAASVERGDEAHAEMAKACEPTRTPTLVVVPPAPSPISETDALIKEALTRPRPRRHLSEIADDAMLARREAAASPQTTQAVDDVRETASPARRFVGGVVDLVVVAFAASPFAAIMELTSGDWHDPRVDGSLAGVVLVIMFVYLTATVAFTGRTWGMALVSVRAVDERNGLIPTAGQCARRAFFYILSLATLGLGLLPALLGRDRRALHDRLSGTIVACAK